VSKLAVNLLDLDRLDPLLRQILLGGKLDVDNLVMVGKEVCVAFTCDLLTAACTCEGIRVFDKKAQRHPTRTYINRGDGWVKLTGLDTLVVVEGNRCKLNRDLFPPPPVAASQQKVDVRPVRLGGKQ
jgi:hypothetical protein